MSKHSETLFLFEFLVENIRLERLDQVYNRLALFLRLLDFPPLLIHQPSYSNTAHTEQEGKVKPGEYVFNRGKSCVFKMNLRSLLTQLSSTPLYATVLDVTEDSPRLVGSSLISLAKAVDRIKQGGVSSPSSLIKTGLSAFCNLAGERIGTISLSYKLMCLGASLLPHIADRRGFNSSSLTGGQQQERADEKNKPPESFSPIVKSQLNDGQTDSNILLGEGNLDDSDSQKENLYEDLTGFCPPRLYYSNTAQERTKIKEVDFKSLNFDSEAFTYEDSCSEEEKNESPHQKVLFSSNVSVNQEAGVVTPNILRETLKQLPLLNALVAELSLLTGSVHSSHRPELTAPLKHPRNCSTPSVNPKTKDSQEEVSTGNKSSSKSPRKKLVYGTTKTFNLRLKQVSPLEVKRRECTGLMQKETQPKAAAGKTKSKRRTVKFSRRKSELNLKHSLSENIETAIQGVVSVTVKQKTQRDGQDSCAQRDLLTDFHPQRRSTCVHFPSVDSDGGPPGKDEHPSRSDQSEFHDDKFKFLLPHVDEKPSSRHGSPESSFSESSINGNEDVDYADDFDSLEYSDASLPGSPESSRVNTPKSPPVCPDSRSEEIKPVPGPVKAPGSPLRALMGTHIIRPRTPSLGSSIDGDDGDRSASLQTICSRKPTTAGDRVERNSSAASFLSSQSGRTESPRDKDSVRRFSENSTSSSEAQGAEDTEDELGSLDFTKKYRHISELVASKLPGYTM